MPLYEYECEACGQRFELIRKFSDPEVDVCAVCGKGPVQRLLSSPAIQFKGTGWYITDYAQKGRSETPAGEKGTEKKGEAPAAAKSDSGTKSEATSQPAAPATKSDT